MSKYPIRDVAFYVMFAALMVSIARDVYDYITITRPMNLCAERAKASPTKVATCRVSGMKVIIKSKKE